MRKEIVNCDKCGKDMTHSPNHYNNHLKFSLYYWHGGSVGGDEDKKEFDIDLCEDCARKLSGVLSSWLNNKKED